jgi:hypothetical protein
VKFRYLGEKDNMTVYGYDFTNGNAPDVTDELAIRKLSGNSQFEAIKEEVKKVKAAAEKPTPAPAPPADQEVINEL